MARKKAQDRWFYVQVMTEHGPVLVTSIDWAEKTARWEKTGAPKNIPHDDALWLAMALSINGNFAVVLESKFALTGQLYCYDRGEFRWEAKTEEASRHD